MGTGTKILLGVVAAVVLVCVCACGVGFIGLRYTGQILSQSVVDDPDQVTTIAKKITDYKLPPGYVEEFGLDLLGYTMVAFSSDETGCAIMLMQFPSWLQLSQAEMEKQMQQQAQGRTRNLSSNLEPEGQAKAIIRGEEVILNVSRGTSNDGMDVRQVTGVFSGKGGTSLLMIVGAVSQWDDAAVDAFLASLS